MRSSALLARLAACSAASAKALADYLERDGAEVSLADVAYTVNHHRSRYPTIATVCARDHADAVTGLRALRDALAVLSASRASVPRTPRSR